MSVGFALKAVVDVDSALCVNCHKCISVCPVKYCNDGSGDVVHINHDTCIGCGTCIDACTHGARYYIDDFQSFINDLVAGVPIVAVVAPAAAASFTEKYLQLNTFLKELNVSAVFDVSFGAELTVKSYLEHIQRNNPPVVIAQPCPAIVNFIEIYKPELIQYLAPADSPVLHTIKMIKEYYPHYAQHKIVFISPCISKKHEFEETGFGDYNVTMKSVNTFLENNHIRLDDYAPTGFDNPDAERAVVFSSPGGLTKTLERWIPDASEQTRKIEGVDIIYRYLEQLPDMIEKGIAPLIIDCLNCENGCNQGPGTLAKHQSPDETEYYIKKRAKEQKDKYLKQNNHQDIKSKHEIEKILDAYWKPGLYDRKYVNRWKNLKLEYPLNEEIKAIYKKMLKTKPEDEQNCAACGYGTCLGMALAIHNGLNRVENCHLYRQRIAEQNMIDAQKNQQKFTNLIHTAQDGFFELNPDHKILTANESTKKILLKSDIVGISIFSFISRKCIPLMEEKMKLVEKGEHSSFEMTFVQSDGNTIASLVSVSPLFDFETRQNIGSFGFITDISYLKQTEEELRNAKENLEDKVKERTSQLHETLEEVEQQKEALSEQTVRLEEVIEELHQQQEEITTQKEIIEQERSKLDNVMEMLPDAAFMIDEKGIVTFWNLAMEELTGVPANDMVGKGNYAYAIPFYGEARPILIDLVNADEAYIKEKYKGVEHINNVLKAETYVPELKGQQRYLVTRATAIYDSAGQFKGAIEIIDDYTTQKQAQEQIEAQSEELMSSAQQMSEMVEELRVSNEFVNQINVELTQLSIVASKTDNAILMMDKDGNFEWLNKAFTDIYGLTLNGLIEQKGSNLIEASNYEHIESVLNKVIETGTSSTFTSIETNRNGEMLYSQTTLTPIFDENSLLTNLVAVSSDITELKKSEMLLREYTEEIEAQRDRVVAVSEKIKQIVLSLPDAAFVIDAEGKIEFWNTALEEMTGFLATNLIGKGNFEYAIPFYGDRRPILIDLVKLNEVDLAQNYKNIYRKNNILQAETYVPNLKNKEHYLVGTATALYDSDGNYAGAIEIIHDITQRQYYIKEIEQQRQNIIESIQYALHIQEALLPDLSVLKNVFAGYFLCFKPRDIVSGDFYWTYQHKNKTVLLAADCTGHGVPGAMMSMLGISFLNQIVHHMEQLHTNIILDKLRRMIITYLSKEDLNIQRKDGMDMSLVIFDKETMQMEFSGANISLFVTSANIPVIIEGREFKQTLKKDELPVKLFEVHGDKMPVGSFIKTNPFSRHTLQLIKGDRFYLFSDGFSDLWNHQSVKKFTIGRFKDLILSSSQLSIDKQYDAIETQYHQWLGNSKQVDDIVIIGVEV